VKRYHKKVGFPESDIPKLLALAEKFNSIEGFGYSDHCLEHLKYRVIDNFAVLSFIKDAVYFDADQIFEYYTLDDEIEKICFRFPYNNGIDLILVLSEDKVIITIYINSVNDKHETLNESLYERI